jgi:hypothetical protein
MNTLRRRYVLARALSACVFVCVCVGGGGRRVGVEQLSSMNAWRIRWVALDGHVAGGGWGV